MSQARSCSTSFITTLYEACYRSKPKKKDINNVPHYDGLTIADCIGSEKANDSEAFSNDVYAATELAKQSPSRKCWTNLGLVIYHPNDIKNILEDNVRNLETEESFSVFGPYFNKSHSKVIMAQATGTEEHLTSRSAFLSALFEEKALKELFVTIKNVALKLTEQYKDQKTVDINQFASRFAIRTMLHGVAKAPDIDDETIDRLAHYVPTGIDEAVKIGSVATLTAANTFGLATLFKGKAEPILKKAEDLILNKVLIKNEKAITETKDSWLINRAKDNQGKIERALSYLSSWFAPSVTSNDSVKEVAFLITAGSETTTNNMVMTFLAILQDEKLFEELSKEVMSVNKPLAEMTKDDFNNLPLLKKVTYESLRHNPPIPIQKTKTKTAFTTHDGIEIPAGTDIFTNIRASHRCHYESKANTKEFLAFYKDPDKFNPHRFDQFDEKTLNKFLEAYPQNFNYKYAFQPFGRASRICPGRKTALLEASVALFTLIYHFNLRLMNDIKNIRIKTTFGAAAVSIVPDVPIEVAVMPRVKM